jgi:tetratricopeptide (TPR) repeat protein
MKQTRRKFLIQSTTGFALLGLGNIAFASEDVSSLIDLANRQIEGAEDKTKLEELIRTYEKVLSIDPKNYEALWQLGRYSGLMALAYSDDVETKKRHYNKMIGYCERGMRTNPEFDELMKNGEKVYDACRVLTKNEIGALFYWYAGNIGIANYCMPKIKMLWYMARNLRGNKKVMNRMMEIDAEWGGGHPYFTWAAYYSVMPKILGGDMEKAKWYFDKAVEAGPNWLYIRHSRASYYHAKRKNKKAFIEDLEWVVAQDATKADSPYPADVHFQKTAREMLENMDDYF